MSPSSEAVAIETRGLGKRFGENWALQDCSITVPRGHVTALVGPNGAGKTTLLRLLVGLSTPSAGTASVLGNPVSNSESNLSNVGYLAQDVPLYKRLSAEDHLRIGERLNRVWDASIAQERLVKLGIALDRPVATLSGGQRAQVGLGLALAKRPSLLLLDEPVAALDPLARHEFLAALSEAVADGDLSVVLSSHLLHDLERVCDHVILLAASRTQLCESIDGLVETHRLLVGPRTEPSSIERGLNVIKAVHTANQTRLLVRLNETLLDPRWAVSEVGLEEIILAYMGVAGTSGRSLALLGSSL